MLGELQFVSDARHASEQAKITFVFATQRQTKVVGHQKNDQLKNVK
jgi:hypothetical protein